MSTKETKKSCLLIPMKINKEPLEKWRAYTEHNEKESLSDSLIKRTTAYINRCYSQPDLILSKLADEIHVTAPYLSNSSFAVEYPGLTLAVIETSYK